MNDQNLNLFIVDSNPVMLNNLKEYLAKRFGGIFNITPFNNGISALKKMDGSTKVIVLDYYLDGLNGEVLLESMKKNNPRTKIIMLASNNEIGSALDAYCNNEAGIQLKNLKTSKKRKPFFDRLANPMRFFVKEFLIRKYLLVFLLTFIAMGLGVYYVVNYMY